MNAQNRAHLSNNTSLDTAKTQVLEVKTLTPIQRAIANPSSRKLSIDAYCYDCSYDKLGAGTWRQQVEACTHTKCPLFNHRPMSGGAA